MPKLRAHNLSISLDGYLAGPNQGPEHPLGIGAMPLHEWIFETDFGRDMMGEPVTGAGGLDQRYAAAGEVNIGATIMGRNMFGPIRGEWPDYSWTGWWGPNPPYHHEVFVLTHYPRPSLDMEGGTVFHFVEDTPETVLKSAFEAAGGKDVRLGGGAATVRQFLRAGLVDELHLAQVPILLGAGERLYENLGALPGLECTRMESSDRVTHLTFTRVTA
ncbi:dihydrofolate reductase family protein [Nocardia huaxiensis]|uniref:dihydrofolate reductase family protein n=1 Tax=Nocardia huaxiensis TaxID=2755382 RepID=UPI001E38F93D|nr:dihydrofolate reductase family protein [Nocardia huaxiensis]UFS96420.1 dihydrofolate reductase family protein [Nocardia huaxiensis]